MNTTSTTIHSDDGYQEKLSSVFAYPSNGMLIFFIMMGAIGIVLLFLAWKFFSVSCFPKLKKCCFSNAKNLASRHRSSFTSGEKLIFDEEAVYANKKAISSKDDHETVIDLVQS